MAPVGTLERSATFECARCGGTIERSSRPRTCPHCQAKKADRCQLCDRAVYIGAPRCPEHAVLAPDESDRPTAMLPPAPPPVHASSLLAPRWVGTVARAAIAMSLLVPAGWVARNQTRLRIAASFDDLRALVVSDAPHGFEPVADGTGPADLEQVVADDLEGDTARAFLVDAGLLRAYTAEWSNGAVDRLGVEVYQYRGHEGALADEARGDRLAPMLARKTNVSWQTFSVDSVPHAHGYHFSGPGGAVLDVVTFARGPYAVAVSAVSTDPATARSLAIATAEHQRAKLSRSERVERLVTDTLQRVRP